MADSLVSYVAEMVSNIISELFGSPINIALIILITVLVYKIATTRRSMTQILNAEPELPRLRRDFTLEELKPYDGNGPDGRILVAVNGKVFDVTKGKRFYGPGGPYSAFAGHDASRGLATFSVVSSTEEWDDLSDLNSMEMESVREWEMQFTEKYSYVGRLLKPGELPTNYSEEEDEGSQQEGQQDDQQEDKQEEPKEREEKQKGGQQETVASKHTKEE